MVIRTRKVLSNEPNPAPTMVIRDAAVTAETTKLSKIPFVAETYKNDELSTATSLRSTLTANFLKMPREGDKVQVNAVSLRH